MTGVAFNPTFIIDKSDPKLNNSWPSGLMGLFWRMVTLFFAKPPAVAGRPIGDLMLSHRDRSELNGALYKLGIRAEKPDKAMNDEVLGTRLRDELERLTGVTP